MYKRCENDPEETVEDAPSEHPCLSGQTRIGMVPTRSCEVFQMQHEQQTDPNAQQAAQHHNVFEQGMETLHSNQTELNRVQIQYSQLEPTPITRQPAVAREPWPGFDTPNTPTCATHVERQNMDVFMAVSCFVCLCCSPLFGGIAYCVAMKGQTATVQQAKQIKIACVLLNVFGVIISCVVLTLVLKYNTRLD